jgi:predicted DNA-binding protein (MmcQ/YjbR family)
MTHPHHFDDDDPLLERVRRITLGFPDAAEKVSHGRPAFFTTKVFAYYGGAVRSSEGQWTQHGQSIVFKADPSELEALQVDPRCYPPAYFGASGWIGLDLTDHMDWNEVRELLESSYRLTAGPKRVARLDAEFTQPG